MLRHAVQNHRRAAVVISAVPSPVTAAATTYLLILIVVFASLRARQGERKLNERRGVGINREVVKSLMTYMLRRAVAVSSAVPSPAVGAAYL